MCGILADFEPLELSLIIKVFFLEFHRNGTCQKQRIFVKFLHFSLCSKVKQSFKPLSLFHNLTFEFILLHKVKKKNEMK